ncbi:MULTISPECIES: ABC transporter permease [Undibacterium]|jgi:putative ABC transport system permease protein|uniref:ABC transporter permease n=2 Tax=Undibacterium TaxID=401469 RepID=A0A941DEJ4_9BURK|nr:MULTISPECIES: ABC transporter permease [Undibacterium]MBR7746636.1 ABC transporter permease [Undibacterium baiyunense]GGX05840.1 ABC transporter permease [Undibacterium macrobrachii]
MNRALILEAIVELKRRKLRTGLTLLGMVFGVAAIVAMLAVGEGSKREALRLVAELGLNNILLESKNIATDKLKDIRTRSLGLSAADASAAMSVVPGAQSVALRKEIKVDQLVYGTSIIAGRAFAVSHSYAEHGGLQIAQGRWLQTEDSETLAPVCVIGARLAKSLFGEQNPIGERVKLNHTWLEVVGVLADRSAGKSEFEGIKLGLDDERLFVPWESGRARFLFTLIEDEVDGISLRLDGKVAPDTAARVLQTVIAQRHANADDTNLIVPMGLYRQNQQTQRIFTIVMSSIAAVSLLVGGIGIMNIMLANVLERRREIGLKRALGARRRDVVEQFLAEALVIAVSGALMGVVLGAIAAYSIATLAGWSVAWSPISLLIAVSMCIAVGLAFGVFPAKQASRLDPIAALRSDG